ncbi:tRNA preQ1(34) S-adenosylmethionine ribosyltransferase-isomerase QueA [Rhizomicrobium electricum]|uniref:S-adenosylmethionine:tRNA ribosyltransferase-isomerase n=1 Tax=Rhizomicrobium electricum TaxID=480070 RepID=A0ABN1EB32_9PROT|nr:tRNA preQ1(34) S-adenosylmethionine ribosyltransferase-isomerase QueA [Rhizomicrobium electricum]NIJ48124.1 S-adenosylmethionine:tRNA ribosyltransferase-isomerase [Rhizomicrobium electricum]
MDVSLFDFDLPEDLIALRPAEPRDSARLLVVHEDGRLEHARVCDLPAFLRARDVLVVNDTKVIQARLRGIRERAGSPGAKIELLLHRRSAPDRFWAFARPAKKLHPGDTLKLGTSIAAHVVARGEAGEVEIGFELTGARLDAAIAAEGETPLPPYIAGKRKADTRDIADYQTIYAREEGSVAAPTAGLHFTPELFTRLTDAGVTREHVTLHVGPGTFLPVSATDTSKHKMHSEYAVLEADAAARLNAVRADGGRIVAVGTTSLRTLESAATPDRTIHPMARETDIFITPGYQFRTADVLLTNFHLPRSTLFMLVSAFSGLDTMQRAYAEAIRERYRFYSYGDACLLFRRP